MILVFGSVMFFYQNINIKVLNNVKINNIFKTSEVFKFNQPISVLKAKQTPIG